ncbi:hypothetical protein WMY93_017533 [Mugilogobius chulae]|uniref:Fibronectin type-III domain-containing protein n=1 Tax=Mugilogobius chulae TaxID=88201 RepID=A0AAW0NVL3_9GOBI
MTEGGVGGVSAVCRCSTGRRSRLGRGKHPIVQADSKLGRTGALRSLRSFNSARLTAAACSSTMHKRTLCPPSPPRNLMFNLNDSFLLLEWSPPFDTGGRRDLTYNVQCKRCGSEPDQCQICEEELRFLPRPLGLTNATVTVTDFSAHANYTFEIESLNGVSDLSLIPRQVAFITSAQTRADAQFSTQSSGRSPGCGLNPFDHLHTWLQLYNPLGDVVHGLY